jgi:oxygen-dependent protoporphyrinogen oxidase
VVVLEAGDRVGGSVNTIQRDGFLFETGPDSFITDKPAALNLCRRLGIEDQLISTAATGRRSYVVRSNTLAPVPAGFQMVAPGKIGDFLASPILSWPGRLRALLDLVIPRRRDEGDESLASFVSRRLGGELLDRLAAPMVGGVYGADPARLSLQATMPRFQAMERKHRSLIRALQASTGSQRPAAVSGPRYCLFATPAPGMGTIVDALVARLPEDTIQLSSAATSVSRSSSVWSIETGRPVRWPSDLADESRLALTADGLILALPAYRASEVLRDSSRELAAGLASIRYGTSVTVSLAYDRAAVHRLIDGFGFVVPKVEGLRLTACTISSAKFSGRAPAERVLVRVFLGEDAIGLDDAATLALAHGEIAGLMDIAGEPLTSVVARHPKGLPQYEVGHLDRVARIESLVQRQPSLGLAGNGYRGLGIPDCIASGELAAENLLNSLPATGMNISTAAD